jgi:hypothetical protein
VQPRRWTGIEDARSTPTILTTLAAGMLAAPVAAFPELPDEVVLNGVVRDFLVAHPDFEVVPSEGFGNYAGLLDETLGGGALVFLGTGRRVITAATDSASRPIAPHIANASCGSSGLATPPLLCEGRIRGRNQSIFDAYDSSLGAYGGGNVMDAVVATNSIAADMLVIDNTSVLNGDGHIGPGGDPAVVVDVQGTMTGTVSILTEVIPLPPVTPPAGLPVYPGGDLDVPIGGSVTIDADWHVMGEFDIKRNATVTIDGDVTFLVEDRWLVGKDSTIVIPDGSSLTIYCRSQARLYGPGTRVNPDTANPAKLEVYLLGDDIYNHQLDLTGAGTMLCGKIVARQNIVDLDQSAQFYGTFAGAAVEINNQSRLHVDMRDLGAGGIGGGGGAGDTAAVLDTTISAGGITSAATFAGWYHDSPGTNLSLPLSITLVKQDGDFYLFDDATDPLYSWLGGFFPIDGRLFGDEGSMHNHHFSYAVMASFVYVPGQYLVLGTDSD